MLQKGVRMAKITPTIQVYESLKKKIEQGVYAPAESLPEIDLAKEYQVSRNTIKKALMMLANDALVSIEPNKATKVRSYSKTEVLEFLEFRTELEGFIIRKAVPVFSSSGIEQLGHLLKEMEAHLSSSDLMAYSASNRQFHSIIYENCPNRTSVDVMMKLKNQMSKYESKTILIPNRGESSLEEHIAILDAVKNRNADLAEACMRQHIQNVRQVFDEYYTLLF